MLSCLILFQRVIYLEQCCLLSWACFYVLLCMVAVVGVRGITVKVSAYWWVNALKLKKHNSDLSCVVSYSIIYLVLEYQQLNISTLVQYGVMFFLLQLVSRSSGIILVTVCWSIKEVFKLLESRKSGNEAKWTYMIPLLQTKTADTAHMRTFVSVTRPFLGWVWG